MVSAQDAFTDAWRSYRIRQGDSPATLPDPLGKEKRKKAKAKKGKRVEHEEATGGGGFLVEEEGEGDSAGGGFIVDDEQEDEGEEEEETGNLQALPEHIPLSSIPDALASLSLPTNDDFVLDLFAQTATYINNDSRRRKRTAAAAAVDGDGAGLEKVVSFYDFQRVVDVLVEDEGEREEEGDGIEEEEGQEEGEDNGEEEKEEEDEEESSRRRTRPVRAAASTANKKRRRQIRAEDAEDGSDEEDVYATESEEEEEVPAADWKPKRTIKLTHKNKIRKSDSSKASPRKSASGGTRRQRGRVAKSKETSTDNDDDDDEEDEDEEDEGHLTTHQRRQVHAAFHLFTNKLTELKGVPLDDQPRLSKEDLKLLVVNVGEKIPDKEIEEMVDEGIRFFAKASSRDVTRQMAKLRRDAEAGRATARGETNRAHTVGIDEFAGVLLKGRLI